MKVMQKASMLAVMTFVVIGGISSALASEQVFSDKFDDFDTKGWTNTGKGKWIVDFQGGKDVVVHQGKLTGKLEHPLVKPGQSTESNWTIEFEYNWLWGKKNSGCMLGIGLLDDKDNGYLVGILQSGGRNIQCITAGKRKKTIWGGGMPALRGLKAKGVLQKARFAWNRNKNTLAISFWNGKAWVGHWAIKNKKYSSFSKIVLYNLQGRERAAFANISVKTKLTEAK